MSGFAVDYASVDENAQPDFRALKASGVDVVQIRAAWGASPDRTLARDVAAATAAGLLVGAYGFLRTDQAAPTPKAQADACADVIGTAPAITFPCAMDLEFAKGRKATGRTIAETMAWAGVYWSRLRERLGYAPMLYTSRRVWIEDLGDPKAPGWERSPLFLTRYVCGARQPAQWRHDVVPGVPDPWAGAWWQCQYQGDALVGRLQMDLSSFNYFTCRAGDPRTAWVNESLSLAEGLAERLDVTGSTLSTRIHAFQTARGLWSDGTIGPATFAALAMAPAHA